MHLYYITRGIKEQVDKWIESLESQFLPYSKNKEGEMIAAQFAVRPIQLWEFVFPKQHRDLILNTCGYPPVKDWKSKYMSVLRMMLKAKKVPDDIDMSKVGKLPLRGVCVGTELVGYRDDGTYEIMNADGNMNEYPEGETL